MPRLDVILRHDNNFIFKKCFPKPGRSYTDRLQKKINKKSMTH